ncbi:FAD-binding oxidoreductase [Rhodovarius crocodyli]|uniref:FAD-binding oxidoreductase n=1 Tax=Rhodovarius crocodyli TaxID=1979269 RepID=A0A437MJ61_9PROT|nr:FAD-binding oxidoreductase [Rhodovarius crocodyli]RVT97625.1 FAD-binding oxidoreductase [Rhodovarius crocodyli]
MPRPLPPSLYAVTAIPAVHTPPLEGDAQADVAIIGAGFTGLSTALHLAERGVSCIVLEANEPGWGASGRNGGQVNPGLKHRPDEVEAHFGPELGRRMVAFSHAAPDYVFELIRRHQIRCEARQGGTLRAATSAKSAAELRKLADVCAERGMPTRLLEGPAMEQATGTGYYQLGFLDPRGGDVQPLSYARGLARAALALGARIHGDTPATALKPQGDGWLVETPRGKVRAGQVLLATNGYTDALWPGLEQSVVPVFSSIRATEPLAPDVAASILPLRGSVFETGRITVYYRVDQENRLLMGGRGPQGELQGTAGLDYLVAHTERLWPQLKGATWSKAWNGRVAITQDHYPHIHELAPGLISCVGYNGRGVAMSSHMGRILAEHLATGDKAGFDMPFLPLKPIAFHRFWKLGVWAEVWRGRVLDRLGM